MDSLLSILACKDGDRTAIDTVESGGETVVAVGAPSRADGSFGAWLRPWRIVLISLVTRVGVLITCSTNEMNARKRWSVGRKSRALETLLWHGQSRWIQWRIHVSRCVEQCTPQRLAVQRVAHRFDASSRPGATQPIGESTRRPCQFQGQRSSRHPAPNSLKQRACGETCGDACKRPCGSDGETSSRHKSICRPYVGFLAPPRESVVVCGVWG